MSRLARAVLATLALCACHSVWASGVIYRWQSLTPTPYLGDTSGFIEIDPAYWQPGGSLSFSLDSVANPQPLPGLLAFEFTGSATPTTPVVFRPHPCDPADPLCQPGEYTAAGGWIFNITFGSLLTGSIYANDTNSDVMQFSSDGPVWTIQSFNTDGYPYECFQHLCSGGTGLWVLDLGTVPLGLPEPSSIGLVAVALGLLVRRLRRNQTRSL